MFLTVEDAFRFAAELECGLRGFSGDESSLHAPRNIDTLIAYFEERLGGAFLFDFEEIDFHDVTDLAPRNPFRESCPANRTPTNPATTNASLRSFIANYDGNADGALVLLNGPMMNHCWRRLCKIKESSQAVLRRYSRDRAATRPVPPPEREIGKEYMCADPDGSDIALVAEKYPDTRDVASAARLLMLDGEREVTLKEFNDPKLPIQLRVEKSGEILAALLLYPPTAMVRDRDGLLEDQRSIDGSLSALAFADFFPIADNWKIPKKMVQSFLTYDGLEYCTEAYEKKLRDLGCTPP